MLLERVVNRANKLNTLVRGFGLKHILESVQKNMSQPG